MKAATREFWRVADQLIHHHVDVIDDSLPRTISVKSAIGIVMVFGMMYGGVMGSYAWMVGRRSLDGAILQMTFSAFKVPLLLMATFAITIPSFYVLNSLLGLRRDFRDAVRNIIACQAVISIVLCSLAPLLILWYASVPDTKSSYAASIFVNVFFFSLASFASQACLRRLYRPLIQRDRYHRYMLWTWLSVYALVGIQMGWILRPFIGHPGQETNFLRTEPWDNAYLKLLEIAHSIF